jgi:RNA polymerase sigma-70 factor (ECF subfamily)
MEREPTDAAVFAHSVSEPQLFTLIFERYYRPVYGYLSRHVGRTVADDLAAETFTRAFERRAAYDRAAERALPWLLGIAVNLLAHHHRRSGRQRRALAALGEPDALELFEDGATRRADSRIARTRLREAVEQLDDHDRDALLLYAWGELTYPEIAGVLGVPVGTVRSRLNRARRKLREGLEPQSEGNVIQLPGTEAQSA